MPSKGVGLLRQTDGRLRFVVRVAENAQQAAVDDFVQVLANLRHRLDRRSALDWKWATVLIIIVSAVTLVRTRRAGKSLRTATHKCLIF
jgi:hypothetical protein